MPKVTAHRGYWKCEGSAQNTLSSLSNAATANLWGSEFDVWMTSDDSLVVTHDSKHHGMPVKDTPLAQLRKFPALNGEILPTVNQYLEKALEYPDLHLVFEIKAPSKRDSLYEARIVPACIEAVKKFGVEDRTTFIAFSLSICEEIAKQMPGMRVQYLNGNLTPQEVHERGINGIDYNYTKFLAHPEWVKQAQDLGITVNCWTVNAEHDIKKMIELGVDQITTDEPLRAVKIISESRK